MQVPSLENKGGGANHTESLNSNQAISQHSNSITVFGKLYSVFLNPVANSANICTTEQCQSQARRKQVGAANDLCYRRTVSLVWNCFYKAQQLGIIRAKREEGAVWCCCLELWNVFRGMIRRWSGYLWPQKFLTERSIRSSPNDQQLPRAVDYSAHALHAWTSAPKDNYTSPLTDIVSFACMTRNTSSKKIADTVSRLFGTLTFRKK